MCWNKKHVGIYKFIYPLFIRVGRLQWYVDNAQIIWYSYLSLFTKTWRNGNVKVILFVIYHLSKKMHFLCRNLKIIITFFAQGCERAYNNISNPLPTLFAYCIWYWVSKNIFQIFETRYFNIKARKLKEYYDIFRNLRI